MHAGTEEIQVEVSLVRVGLHAKSYQMRLIGHCDANIELILASPDMDFAIFGAAVSVPPSSLPLVDLEHVDLFCVFAPC